MNSWSTLCNALSTIYYACISFLFFFYLAGANTKSYQSKSGLAHLLKLAPEEQFTIRVVFTRPKTSVLRPRAPMSISHLVMKKVILGKGRKQNETSRIG